MARKDEHEVGVSTLDPEVQEEREIEAVDEGAEWLLTRDLRKAADTLTDREVRYLVDLYYQMQQHRIDTKGIVRSSEGEPNLLTKWFHERARTMEARIPSVMKRYCESRRDGRWLLSIHGIGPVLAAGLLAHIDITRANTAGKVWSFAGLNPDMKWEKGQRRPFNADLKVLCWKIGQSFMKLRANDKDIYGRVYEERKRKEVAKNESGGNAGYDLKGYPEFRKKIGVPSGPVPKLPDGIVDARARRYAVKLFLSHLQHVMWETRFGEPPPKPYVITHMEHADYIAPPNWPTA